VCLFLAILGFHITSSLSKIKKIINPSVVLVSSDVRPSNNFKPDRVPHLKDCALRDIKMLDRRGSRVGQKMNYCSSFC